MPAAAKAAAVLLAAVAEPTRIRIIRQLADGEMNVGVLAAALNLEVVNASHHLGVMREAGC